MLDAVLLDKVKDLLRVDGDDDNALIVPLISAAKQYLENAGVDEPEGDGEYTTEASEVSLYELAVALYVHSIYYGGTEEALSRSLDGIIVQLKNWGEAT